MIDSIAPDSYSSYLRDMKTRQVAGVCVSVSWLVRRDVLETFAVRLQLVFRIHLQRSSSRSCVLQSKMAEKNGYTTGLVNKCSY